MFARSSNAPVVREPRGATRPVEGQQESKRQVQLKLKEARKGLSREEYTAWARQQSAAEADLEAALKSRVTELEHQARGTSNEFLREQIEGRIRQIEMVLAAEEASRIGDQTARDIEEAEAFVLKERALQRGPLFSQRVGWWFADQKNCCARLVGAVRKRFSSVFQSVAATISEEYEPAVSTLSLLTIVCGLGAAIWFAWTSGLGQNLFVVSLVSLLLSLLVLSLDGKAKLTVVLAGILAFYGGTTFSQCFTPSDGYAGARVQQGKIIEILDSRDWFIKPPRFWKGETIEWVDLAKPESRGREESRAPAFHEVVVSNNKLLICNFDFVPLKVGFQELFETKRSPQLYRELLLAEVRGILDDFTEESSLRSINRMKGRINLLSNRLFRVSEAQVLLQPPQ